MADDKQQQLYDATVQHVAKREQQYAETMASDLTAEQWQSIAEGQKKANWFHYGLLREIQDDVLLAIQSNYDRDQLQLVLTQIQVKLMDNGIHPRK